MLNLIVKSWVLDHFVKRSAFGLTVGPQTNTKSYSWCFVLTHTLPEKLSKGSLIPLLSQVKHA